MIKFCFAATVVGKACLAIAPFSGGALKRVSIVW